MPRRIRNWDNRVVEWATAQRARPFVWGVNDCVSLLRQMLAVGYGEPIGPDVSYDSLESAREVVAATGGVRAVVESLGALRIPLSTANTGDVLIDSLREGDPFEAVLCVVTDKMLFADPEGVITLIPLRDAPREITAYRFPYGR